MNSCHSSLMQGGMEYLHTHDLAGRRSIQICQTGELVWRQCGNARLGQYNNRKPIASPCLKRLLDITVLFCTGNMLAQPPPPPTPISQASSAAKWPKSMKQSQLPACQCAHSLACLLVCLWLHPMRLEGGSLSTSMRSGWGKRGWSPLSQGIEAGSPPSSPWPCLPALLQTPTVAAPASRAVGSVTRLTSSQSRHAQHRGRASWRPGIPLLLCPQTSCPVRWQCLLCPKARPICNPQTLGAVL